MKDIVFSGHQPNFLPYMGLFYKILKSDVFVLDDDVQYTTAGCLHSSGLKTKHNSNLIRSGNDVQRIQVPVYHYSYTDLNKVAIANDDHKWKDRMLKAVRFAYSKHPYFYLGYGLLSNALDQDYDYLWELNTKLIKDISEGFGFKTKIVLASTEFDSQLSGNDRNIHQCLGLGANVYYSGVGGKAYNDEKAYADNGIKLVYTDYQPVIYPQYHKKDFIENLSVLDYIMNCGFDRPQGWWK